MLDSFPCAYIIYNSLLIILVTIAFIEIIFFKIKIDNIISKINYVTRKIRWINYIIN